MAELLCSNLPQRLVKARRSKNISMGVLGGLCGLAESTIRMIEIGRHASAVSTVELIANALGVSPAWLAYGVGSRDYDETRDPALRSEKLLCGNLSHRLVEARRASGMSMETLGKCCGISASTVRRAEIDMNAPGVDTAELMANALGVSPAWLAYGVGSRHHVVEVREPPPDVAPLSASGLRPGRGRYFTITKK